TSPSPRAICAQRVTDNRLPRIATRVASANTHGSARRNCIHNAFGSTYQIKRASNAAPARMRAVKRKCERGPASAAGASVPSVSAGSRFIGSFSERPPPGAWGRAQHVLRPPLRLMIDADQQLSEQSRCQHLHADQCEQHAEQEQRTAADVMPERELVEC